MTSLKIGSNFSPTPATFRSAVERPVEQARPEPTLASLTATDEFLSEQSLGGPGLSAERLGGPQAAAAAGTLPKTLEPLREALDNIASQISPELLTNPLKLGQFIMNAVKELGVAGKDMMDAVRYIREIALNGGKDRLAQGQLPQSGTTV